jgi:stage IV sporulation protein FB
LDYSVFLAEPQRSQYDINFVLAGVPVRVHPFFWLATLLLGMRLRDPLHLLLWVAAVFVSILVHEFGHSVAMRYFGWRSHIVLYSFGGLAVPDGTYGGFGARGGGARDTRSQVIICFAGPLAGFILAALILVALRATGNNAGVRLHGLPPFDPYFDPVASPQMTLFISFLLYCNVFWGLVNLLPIYPLDGGQISQRVLESANPRDGLQQAFLLSIFSAAGVAIWGYWKLGDFYIAFFFGYLAYQSYMTLQSFRGGGYGGGRGW